MDDIEEKPDAAPSTHSRGVGYSPHWCAKLFPPMSEGEFKRLAASLKVNGLLEPIVLFEGQILDGFEREAACLEAGIEPRYRAFSEGLDPFSYVMAKNVERRQLSKSQRGVIGAKLAKIKHGGDRRSPSWDQLANL